MIIYNIFFLKNFRSFKSINTYLKAKDSPQHHTNPNWNHKYSFIKDAEIHNFCSFIFIGEAGYLYQLSIKLIQLSIFSSIISTIYLSSYLLIQLFTYPAIYLFSYLLIQVSIYLSIQLLIYLSFYQSIYPAINLSHIF